jgi:hypothetical protein
MPDLIESAVERLRGDYLKHSDDIYASQVVSIAIKLCPDGAINESDILGKIDNAIKLIDSAKKIISRIKLAEKQRH